MTTRLVRVPDGVERVAASFMRQWNAAWDAAQQGWQVPREYAAQAVMFACAAESAVKSHKRQCKSFLARPLVCPFGLLWWLCHYCHIANVSVPMRVQKMIRPGTPKWDTGPTWSPKRTDNQD